MALTGVSPGGNARSMVRKMTVFATDDGSDRTVNRPEVRSIVIGEWRSTSSSESCQKTLVVKLSVRGCESPNRWEWKCDYLCCRVGQGFDVTTPESSVWEEVSGRVETAQLAVDAVHGDSDVDWSKVESASRWDVDSSKVESASDENHEKMSTQKSRRGWKKTWLDNRIAYQEITCIVSWTWLEN